MKCFECNIEIEFEGVVDNRFDHDYCPACASQLTVCTECGSTIASVDADAKGRCKGCAA